MNHTGPQPPQNGKEYEGCCARCGSSCDWQSCEHCGGEGFDGHDCGDDTCCCLRPDENVLCHICEGYGGWSVCLSSREWCEANPLDGRSSVKRGTIEWFEVTAEDSWG